MIQTELYSNDVWKQRLKQVNVSKTCFERIEGYGRSYLYLHHIKDLAQGNFQTNNELQVN
jgi:hypothetical protein